MKLNIKKLAICIAIPLIVGGVSALISGGGMRAFNELNKPPLSPPGWLFPVVWTLLYVLMGIASYLVLVSGEDEAKVTSALKTYGLQLAFNFFWSIIFFNLESYLFAFIWLVALWILILLTMIKFFRIREAAGYLLLPYLAWVTFAGYLNLGIYLLN